MYFSNADLRDYYVRQAGSALRVFKGARSQAGNGIFSNFFRKYGIDLLKFIGKRTFAPLKEAGEAIFVNKTDPKEAIKRGFKQSARNLALGAIDSAKDKISQLGTGRRRRRSSANSGTSPRK